MSSKEKHTRAYPADSTPCRYHDDEKTQIPTKKLQAQSIRGQINFGMQLQTFQEKCNTRKLQPKTWPIEK